VALPPSAPVLLCAESLTMQSRKKKVNVIDFVIVLIVWLFFLLLFFFFKKLTALAGRVNCQINQMNY
jgi:hypothetical protein